MAGFVKIISAIRPNTSCDLGHGTRRAWFRSRLCRTDMTIQLAIITLCLMIVAEAVMTFPFPSPFIKPFLPPDFAGRPNRYNPFLVEAENFDGDYLRFFRA